MQNNMNVCCISIGFATFSTIQTKNTAKKKYLRQFFFCINQLMTRNIFNLLNCVECIKMYQNVSKCVPASFDSKLLVFQWPTDNLILKFLHNTFQFCIAIVKKHLKASVCEKSFIWILKIKYQKRHQWNFGIV